MKRFLSHLLVVVLALTAVSCNSSPTAPDADDVTNLEKIDVVVGTGAEATNTHRVTVNYSGYLYEAEIADHRGARFDTTDGSGPREFPLSGVIAGWTQGIPGMKVGGRRTLIIPSRLGYREQGYPPNIPPNSALVFDIELLSVR